MVPRAEMLDRFVAAKRYAKSVEEAAEIMGVTFYALDKALERARADNDWRGVYKPLTLRTHHPRPPTVKQLWEALPEPKPPPAEAAQIIGCKVDTLRRVVGEAALLHERNERVLDEWEFLRNGGEHWERAAARVGVTVPTMHTILKNARAAGDPRGNLTPLEAP